MINRILGVKQTLVFLISQDNTELLPLKKTTTLPSDDIA
jgi:hypothetical protein